MIKTLWEILTKSDTRPVEILNSLTLVVVGFVLVIPGDTFAVSQIFRIIGTIAPDWFWGISFLVIGTFSFFAILSGWKDGRIAASFAKMVTFMTFFFFFVITSPLTTAYIWGVCGLGAAWCSIRINNQRQ